jgi:hypothetical protein
MEEEDHQKELQLLPTSHSVPSSSHKPSRPSASSSSSSSLRYRSTMSDSFAGPALDLQLSIRVRPIEPPSDCVLAGPICGYDDVKSETSCVEALKWQAAEQIRLAAMEKAYAERVRELTRREMELAQTEFARARHMYRLDPAGIEGGRLVGEGDLDVLDLRGVTAVLADELVHRGGHDVLQGVDGDRLPARSLPRS